MKFKKIILDKEAAFQKQILELKARTNTSVLFWGVGICLLILGG